MKFKITGVLALLVSLALGNVAHGQVLVSFYSSQAGNFQNAQTPATDADFGVTNPPFSTVEGFDVGVTGNVAISSVNDAYPAAPTSITSNLGDLTLASLSDASSYRTGFTTGGSGVYQQALTNYGAPLELELTGLSSKLVADTQYYLTLYASNIEFDRTPQLASISYSYGSSSGTQDFSGTYVPYTNYDAAIIGFEFTTGNVVANELDLTLTGLNGSTGTPALSGLAISVPEPSSWAFGLIMLAVLGFEVRRRAVTTKVSLI